MKKQLPKRYAVAYSPRPGHRTMVDFDTRTEAASFAVEHGSHTVLDRKTNERMHIAGMRANPTKPSKRRPKTFERCVQKVKASNRAKTGNELKPYNPWAICNASVRGLRANPAKCEGCGTDVYSMTGRCNACRKAGREKRGIGDAEIAKRAKREGVTVDRAGGQWWVWDRNGNVLVAPRGGNARETKAQMLRRWNKLSAARNNPVITYELVPHEAREWHDAEFRKGVMASVDGIYRTARAPIVIAAAGKVLATRTGIGWQFT